MIPEAEIGKLREDAERLLQGTARIWTRHDTVKPGGGAAHTWTPGANIPARIAFVPRRTLLGSTIAGDLMDVRTTHVITVPHDTQVSEEDQVEYGGKGLFEVTAVRQRSFDELVRRLECTESTEPIPGVEDS